MQILVVKTSTNPNNNIQEVHLEQIKEVASDALINQTTADAKDFLDLIKEAEVILTQNLAVIHLNEAPNLKWIHLTSAGVNNLSDELRNSDVVISNSSGVHPVPISEHVLGFMLMLSRNLHGAYRNQIAGKWVRGEQLLPVDELAGKTVCIVGLGAIGERVAMLAQAFEMKTIGVVRNPNQEREYVDSLFGSDKLIEAIKDADFIVNCLPGTDETKHLFDKEVFAQFKESCFFINIGRGTTVNEADLIEALNNGQLRGAGLDVFETEPLDAGSPLWKMDNVIITPHSSGWSPKYTDRMINIFVDNLKAYLKKEKMPNLVNKELGY